MGRHSSPEPAPFYRSLVGWIVPWTVVALVFGVGVWVAVRAVGSSELDARPDRAGGTSSRHAASSPTPSPEEVAPSPSDVAGDPVTTASATPDLVTEGVTVQVLNGTSSAAADDAMADRLAGLGFEVVAIDEASKAYSQTTVFWSTPDAEAAADALAARFGWVVSPKPANLSEEVSLHVIVGADEA